MTELPDNVDDLIDALPVYTRNKVLAVFFTEAETGPPEEEIHRVSRSRVWPYTRMGLAFLWAMLVVPIGLAFCVTIIGIPIGMAILLAGCVPFTKAVQSLFLEE